MGLVRRIVALMLGLTPSLIGIQFSAHAADGHSPPLTISGQPLCAWHCACVQSDPWRLSAYLLGSHSRPS